MVAREAGECDADGVTSYVSYLKLGRIAFGEQRRNGVEVLPVRLHGMR